jgi:long-chain fatty acid transport protein
LNFNNHNEETSMTKNNVLRATVMASALLTGAAWATDGYFPHGYGMKALGMGGASVAMTDNAFAGANNPATAAFTDSRADLGVNIFSPKRSVTQTTGTTQSDKNAFLIPEFGYIGTANGAMTYGLTVYGNGGMNTDYPASVLGGPGSTGVNLEQLIVAPVLSYKVSSETSVGVSPLLVRQTFSAKGLQNAFNVASSGDDVSTGLGVRLGVYSKLSNSVAFGASYSPKTNMSKFDKYAGLFAEQGKFDIPANYAMGVAVDVSPSVKVAADYQKIQYSGVKAIANASLASMFAGNPLGAANGPGFGWTDVNVFKFGVEWKYSETLKLRAGYNRTTNPVTSADVMFNILAPGVITTHYTVGATYQVAKNSELTWAYMYAPENSVSGYGLDNTNHPTVPTTVRMSQQSLGVQYSWKF